MPYFKHTLRTIYSIPKWIVKSGGDSCGGGTPRWRYRAFTKQIGLLYLPCFAILWVLFGWGGQASTQAQEVRGPLYQVAIEGVATSYSVDYVRRALREAEASSATALIVRISNDGAVLRAIRPLADSLFKAQVPVVVYVAPQGSQSGALGALLLSAGHIAAMAPNTSFGTPVPLGQVDTLLTQQTQALLLDAVANQLHDWNAQRGRNTVWVDRAVREGVLLTNEQAINLTPPAIDLVARDEVELLTLLEGRIVTLADGRERQLSTLGRTIIPIEPTPWEQLRLLLTDPTIAFLLLVMGALAIYGELVSPGVGALAGIGTLLLIGAAAGLLVLPIRGASLLGILAAFIIIGADLYVHSHGGFTVVGMGVLIVSTLTLIDSNQAPGVFVALWAILLVALLIACFVGVAIWLIVRTHRQPIATGQESLVGRIAEVRKRLDPEGMVFIEGALWQATSEDGAVEEGTYVTVVAIHELRLLVRSTPRA